MLTKRPSQFAAKLLEKYSRGTPAGVYDDLWNTIKALANEDYGDALHGYSVECTDGTSVSLETYLELVFMSICVHNVDPESAFSIVGHKLKIAPNTGLSALSAHLCAKKNPATVSAAVFEERYKEAQQEEATFKKRKAQFKGDLKGDEAGVMAERAKLEKAKGERLTVTDNDVELLQQKTARQLQPRTQKPKAPTKAPQNESENEQPPVRKNSQHIRGRIHHIGLPEKMLGKEVGEGDMGEGDDDDDNDNGMEDGTVYGDPSFNNDDDDDEVAEILNEMKEAAAEGEAAAATMRAQIQEDEENDANSTWFPCVVCPNRGTLQTNAGWHCKECPASPCLQPCTAPHGPAQPRMALHSPHMHPTRNPSQPYPRALSSPAPIPCGNARSATMQCWSM